MLKNFPKRKSKRGRSSIGQSSRLLIGGLRVRPPPPPPHPPVLEMANGPALQAGAHFGLPGSNPGWGTIPPSRIRVDNTIVCRKRRSPKRRSADQKRSGWSLKTHKKRSILSSRPRSRKADLHELVLIMMHLAHPFQQIPTPENIWGISVFDNMATI
jgi:hypothetical protein